MKKTVFCSQSGIAVQAVIIAVVLLFIAAVAVTTPQIRNLVVPGAHPAASLAPAASKYSEKQQLYIRNKETIKKGLNLNDQQFELLLQNADKN